MRLTPSWFRESSDAPSEERPDADDTAAKSGVTIYHAPLGESVEGDVEADGHADEFIPDSDAALLAVLDEMRLPATVDEITDELIEPARPPIETWAAVHERLHRTRLPALDTTDDVEFDDEQGVVVRSETRPRATADGLFSRSVVGALTIVLLFGVIALVSASVLTAVTVTLVTTTVAVWIIPMFV